MNIPNFDNLIPKVNIPTFDVSKMAALMPTDENLASEFHKRLVSMVNEFDEGLDQNHEVGMRLVSFGQTIQFHVIDIGYWNPSLIRFIGQTDEGKPLELIQHVSQISFLLMAVPRLNPDEPKRKIGFTTDED